MGEAVARSENRINFEKIIRDKCQEIGYTDEKMGLDYKSMTVVVNVVPQSQEIYDAVHK